MPRGASRYWDLRSRTVPGLDPFVPQGAGSSMALFEHASSIPHFRDPVGKGCQRSPTFGLSPDPCLANSRERLGLDAAVRILVLAYNRTLKGYITELARTRVPRSNALDLRVQTFGEWAYSLLGNVEILDRGAGKRLLRPHIAKIPLPE